VASFSEYRQGLKDRFRNLRWPQNLNLPRPRWPEKWPRPPKPSRPVGIALIVLASILGLIVLAWVVLNLMLANPKYGTPFANWSLGTFGSSKAHVEQARLSRPFSSRFEIKSLDWPGAVEAEIILLDFDLLGFLPNRPWAKKLTLRNGEVMLENKKDDRKTINPQGLVDAVEVTNLDIKFTRRNKLRTVKLVTASGSFSSGTVSGEATSGRNRITFDDLKREWDGSLDGRVTASGDNMKDLAEILGASSPDTPPFKINGQLTMRKRTWSVVDLGGRVGDSDIGGQVGIDLKPKKPFLTVDLKSKQLDFDDLGVVFGIPVGTGKGETANAEQVGAKRAFDRSSRLIPDAHIDFSRLAAVNGDISFEAAKVVDAPSGINALSFKGELRDQVLDMSRVLVKTATGNLDARVRINATKDPASTRASGTLENVAITRLINTSYVKGSLNGAFALNLTGSGFREAFGTATGEAGLWSNNSEVARIATEAAGLDLGEILLLMAKDEGREYRKSRCLAANIAFADGRATLSPAVVDNEDSLVFATGGADLKTERLDMRIFAEPHDKSVGALIGDIKITGTLRHPEISALNAKTVAQGVFGALLSSIAGPLLALPFVEAGGGIDAPCAQLIADSRAAGQAQDPTLKGRAPDKS
jgi:hypothetical protein